MNKVKIAFEHCYGIRKMDAEFDFTKKSAQLIYAPNGAMKSSFALTFRDYSMSTASRDRVYPDRVNVRQILDENGNAIPADSIFVIDPYDVGYQSDRVSTLLVNKELKAEYDEILKTIQMKQDHLVDKLRKISGVKTGIEDIISLSFSRRPDNFLRALDRVHREVMEDPLDNTLSGVKYLMVFSDKIEKFLMDPAVQDALEDYTETYDRLLDRSRFFRKGVFNHYQAGEIAKQLKNHGFFQAEHKVFLHSDKEDTKVETEEELEGLIEDELNSILSDEELRQKFQRIDKKLSNAELRNFREFLLEHQTLIPRLKDLELFRENLLKSYLMQSRDEFDELISSYGEGKKRIDNIVNEATNQATAWQDVINIFNRRFSVPFQVNIENKHDVILKRATPNIGFTFLDGSTAAEPVERNQLLEVLSNGERRALYILNIIFEVEARKSDGVTTIFVIDDIADSFDYKNKYAIVEYLNDIMGESRFFQIILTHNYDFYRTVWNRLNLGGANFHVSKTSTGITLQQETMYKDPFQKWKALAVGAARHTAMLAMIPFVRNLAEYCGYRAEYDTLTSLLHRKPDSDDITMADLFAVYSRVLNGQTFTSDLAEDSLVINHILAAAEQIIGQDEIALDLETKVVLSMAIRLVAEKKMIDVIADAKFVKGLKNNQTVKLIARLKHISIGDASRAQLIALMERVNLMTPENIHLNSFMYEPILDMSSEHLSQLYIEVSQL
ncbi:hypothetical protein [Kordiimonas sp.]|uniref:hypothetical protein n=1 Tax=Kordiimonas sp. TaxID=1970157 RepID=UPI003A924C74